MLAIFSLAWVPFSPLSRPSKNQGYWTRQTGGTQWLNASSFSLDNVLISWSKRESAIRWALRPGSCEALLPLFPEARLSPIVGNVGKITCADLRAVIKSSIDTWTMNHAQLHFHDVTDRCDTSKCDVEIEIDVAHMTDNNKGRAAYVQLDVQDVDWMVTSTAGDRHVGIGLKRAKMVVSLDFCWYLDATFCSIFHKIPDELNLVIRLLLVAMTILCGGIIGDCFVGMGFAAAGKVRPHYFADSNFALPRLKVGFNTGREAMLVRVSSYAAYLPLLRLLFCTFMLIFIPIFYMYVYIPCAECYDMEATFAHEWGHVLGFQHPDTFDTMNLRLKRPMDSNVCHRPFENVELTKYSSSSLSIMHSLTQHSPRTCLNEDDMEGLHVMYPRCESTVRPQCIKTKRYDGAIRFIISVLLPYMFVTLIILFLQRLARRYYHRRANNLEYENKALRKVNLSQKVHGQWARAALRSSMQENPTKRFRLTRRRLPALPAIPMSDVTKRLSKRFAVPRLPARFTGQSQHDTITPRAQQERDSYAADTNSPKEPPEPQKPQETQETRETQEIHTIEPREPRETQDPQETVAVHTIEPMLPVLPLLSPKPTSPRAHSSTALTIPSIDKVANDTNLSLSKRLRSPRLSTRISEFTSRLTRRGRHLDQNIAASSRQKHKQLKNIYEQSATGPRCPPPMRRPIGNQRPGQRPGLGGRSAHIASGQFVLQRV